MIRQLPDKAKEAYYQSKELVVECKDLYDNTKEAFSKFESHWDEFHDALGPMDLIGRSFPHFVFIVAVWSGVLLILYRKKDYPRDIANLVIRCAAALVPAVALGFTYELLRTSNLERIVEIGKSSPDLPVASVFLYLLYGQHMLPVLAFAILATGLYYQRRWLHKLPELREAWEVKELKYFLVHGVLPPHVLQKDEAHEADTPSATPSKSFCPTCGAEIEAEDDCNNSQGVRTP